MTGSGSDDYVFIDAFDSITLFENQHDWGHWKPWGVIYDANRARKEVHLADFDGDGKCDILLVDKTTGTTGVVLNNYKNGEFSFSDIGIVTGAATCKEGYGNDKHDLGVRWNDLDGDGRADFLCIQTDGTITGYLNKGVGDMVNQGLIKRSEVRERKNLRIADINGDGRDDYLYVNMTNGAVTAWHNDGWSPGSDEAFRWQWKSIVATGGFSRGSCVEFGNLYGAGRADYISIKPSTNEGWVWLNICPDDTGSQGPNADPPDLPTNAPPAPLISTNANTDIASKTSQVESVTIEASTRSITTTSGTSTNKAEATPIPKVQESHLVSTITNSVGPSLVTVEIITATDSQGSTLVGTLTKGPSPSSTDIATSSLQTLNFPPSISFTSTSVRANTHDSDGHPVLGPWPLCWFCPPGSDGIVLGGLSGPGIFTPTGPPPGFPTPFPAITIAPNGDPSYESFPDPTKPSTSASDQPSTSTSEPCSTEAVIQITYYVSYATDDAVSTVFTTTTSIYSSTHPGCTASAAITTSTTIGEWDTICAAESCPRCITKRETVSQAELIEGSFKVGENSSRTRLENGPGLKSVKRGFPLTEGNMGEYYDIISEHPNTRFIANDNEKVHGPGISSSRFEEFGRNDVFLRVRGLICCTSIVVVSRKVAWASHLWESSGFLIEDKFEPDIIDYLKHGRDPEYGVEANTAALAELAQSVFEGDDSTYIFIMTPAKESLTFRKTGYSRVELRQSETKGDFDPKFGPRSPDPMGSDSDSMDSDPDRLTPFEQLLGQLLPKVPIGMFGYRKIVEVVQQEGAYGNLMVLYTNQVTEFSDHGEESPREGPSAARWECYMQGKLMGLTSGILPHRQLACQMLRP